ncbi:MAG TPA: hypothetical protein VE504_06620 [Nitrososphaeraceae archaeon]|nr:hypothetical protein [Nitrososphaeraceae archaeon]
MRKHADHTGLKSKFLLNLGHYFSELTQDLIKISDGTRNEVQAHFGELPFGGASVI